jgi:hypothetical protein
MAANDPKRGEAAEDTARRSESKLIDLVSGSNVPEGTPVAPRISAYYSDARVKPTAFVKSVRAAKIKSFHAEDIAQAAQRLGETDPALTRTVALLGKRADAVARWLVDATKAALRLYLPDAAANEHEAAKSLLDRVALMSVDDLAARDRQRRARAQNLLRLVVAWLIDQRNLSPTDALLSVRLANQKRRDGSATASLNRDAARLLGRSKLKQLLDLSLVAALYESAVVEEARKRQEVFSSLAKLRTRITFLETELEARRAELNGANEDRRHLSNQLANAQRELRDERQLRVLDRTRQEGRFRGFLMERLSPPLSDARDALGFNPPHVDAARQRIQMAITAIGGEVGKCNE